MRGLNFQICATSFKIDDLTFESDAFGFQTPTFLAGIAKRVLYALAFALRMSKARREFRDARGEQLALNDLSRKRSSSVLGLAKEINALTERVVEAHDTAALGFACLEKRFDGSWKFCPRAEHSEPVAIRKFEMRINGRQALPHFPRAKVG